MIRNILSYLFLVLFSAWALWRTWSDMGRPWPDELRFKQRSTKSPQRHIFVVRRK